MLYIYNNYNVSTVLYYQVAKNKQDTLQIKVV